VKLVARVAVAVAVSAVTVAVFVAQAADEIATAEPELTAPAQAMLAQAESAVNKAIMRKSLWTTADEAIKLARAAAAKGDSAAVLKHAQTATEQALLGIEQTRYPLVK
jgi:hypothetical protein